MNKSRSAHYYYFILNREKLLVLQLDANLIKMYLIENN